MSYRTDRQRVQGLGTAGDGTGHWWSQRLTSIALVPLTLFFIFPFARNLGADFETVRATYANPFNAIVAILFLARRLPPPAAGPPGGDRGLCPRQAAAHRAAARQHAALTWAFALTGVFAVAKIAFSA